MDKPIEITSLENWWKHTERLLADKDYTIEKQKAQIQRLQLELETKEEQMNRLILKDMCTPTIKSYVGYMTLD